MATINADVTVHVDEELDALRTNTVCDSLRRLDGVREVRCAEHRKHLLVVSYDPKVTGTRAILDRVTEEGLHGSLVGM